jgi:hypothetical protein
LWVSLLIPTPHRGCVIRSTNIHLHSTLELFRYVSCPTPRGASSLPISSDQRVIGAGLSSPFVLAADRCHYRIGFALCQALFGGIFQALQYSCRELIHPEKGRLLWSRGALSHSASPLSMGDSKAGLRYCFPGNRRICIPQDDKSMTELDRKVHSPVML